MRFSSLIGTDALIPMSPNIPLNGQRREESPLLVTVRANERAGSGRQSSEALRPCRICILVYLAQAPTSCQVQSSCTTPEKIQGRHAF